MNSDFFGISPSIVCMDLCNLEKSVKEVEYAGCTSLHIDIIDGYFSPSMPMGIDTISQMRKKTKLPFEVHIMAKDNSFFMDEFIVMGVEKMCFHIETELHIARRVKEMKLAGIEAGVALTPASTLKNLEYIIEEVDFVLLMCINPGFASAFSEKRVPYALEKLNDLSKIIDSVGKDINVTVDGKIYTEDIESFVQAGADTIVGGRSNIFKTKDIKENFIESQNLFISGMNKRKSRQFTVPQTKKDNF